MSLDLHTLLIWELAGILVAAIVGCLQHFLYCKWQNSIVAVFSVASESLWEHQKLVFWPVFFYSIIEYFSFASVFNNFWAAKAVAMLIAMVFMIVAYYGYKHFVTGHSLVGNIILLFACVAVAQHFSNYFISHGWFASGFWPGLGLPIFIVLIVILVVFTFWPPHLGLFQDKIHGTYGPHKY